jgi:MFS family permease
MKINLERFALGLILAPLAPLAGLLSGWWAAYAWLPETWIPFVALTGLLVGVVVDIFMLKKLLERRLSLLLWVAVFLFYSVGVFGFSMGVPVLNTALAIPAGFVIGSRLAAEKADRLRVRKTAQRTAWFTTAVLALICAASALIALVSSSTANDLQGMLGLGFEVTQGMIIGLILAGGAGLLAAGWGLSFASVRLTFSFLQRKV